jgi:hypothetical protein
MVPLICPTRQAAFRKIRNLPSGSRFAPLHGVVFQILVESAN